MSEHLTPEYEAEIRERIDQLDDDRTFPNATWLASSASSKSVFPPAQSHVVEDVVETKHFVTRASVGVFGDKRHAEFTAHARDDIPTLLAEIDRLRAERDAYRAEVLREAIEAARSEYLHDDTGTPEDEAYNQGVTDAVAAIGALVKGGESR